MVRHVDGCVRHYGSVYGGECRPGETRDQAQSLVIDGATCRNVDGGSEALHEVVGDVKRYKFDE